MPHLEGTLSVNGALYVRDPVQATSCMSSKAETTHLKAGMLERLMLSTTLQVS